MLIATPWRICRLLASPARAPCGPLSWRRPHGFPGSHGPQPSSRAHGKRTVALRAAIAALACGGRESVFLHLFLQSRILLSPADRRSSLHFEEHLHEHLSRAGARGGQPA
jgi:hypothetical protein